MDRSDAGECRTNAVRLVFVFNAEAGLAHGLLDSIHKIISPSTYPCALCAITHGAVSMRRAWRLWLQRIDLPAQFFHRSDFRRAWPNERLDLPAILLEQNGQLTTLFAADEFSGVDDVNRLISVLETRLEKARHDHPTL